MFDDIDFVVIFSKARTLAHFGGGVGLEGGGVKRDFATVYTTSRTCYSQLHAWSIENLCRFECLIITTSCIQQIAHNSYRVVRLKILLVS